jgi:hypothetical protein
MKLSPLRTDIRCRPDWNGRVSPGSSRPWPCLTAHCYLLTLRIVSGGDEFGSCLDRIRSHIAGVSPRPPWPCRGRCRARSVASGLE